MTEKHLFVRKLGGTNAMALYDLDRTITRSATFTPFMIHAAWEEHRLRLAAIPLWLAAMLLYGIGLISRKSLKQFGMAMFVGRRLTRRRAEDMAARFADWFLRRQLMPGAVESLARDRKAGRRLVLVTAAPDFYARELGRRLGMDTVIATRHARDSDGTILNQIIGENCYGAEKLERVKQWMRGEGLSRETCDVKVYGDDMSDAPLLEFADEAILVTARPRMMKLARYRGWRAVDFERPGYQIPAH